MARRFDRIIDRMHVILSMNRRSQLKFWDIKEYADEQRKVMSHMFDDRSRSKAIIQLAMMRSDGVVTDEEFASFSPETQQEVTQLMEFHERFG